MVPGVESGCISVDVQGLDCQRYLYGGANCVDEVAKLPLKVSDIDRKITT